MTKEDSRNMQIANCRICVLCKNHCSDCPLNWAIDLDQRNIEYCLKISPAFREVYRPEQRRIEKAIWKEFESAIEIGL